MRSINHQFWFNIAALMSMLLSYTVLHAQEEAVTIEETVTTTEEQTTEGEGRGAGGVSVKQPHKVRETVTVTPSEKKSMDSEGDLSITVTGKKTSVDTVAGEQVEKTNEIQKTITLKSTHQRLKLFLDHAEIIQGPQGQQLKLRIGFKNLTDKPLKITGRSFNIGDFILADSSGQHNQVVRMESELLDTANPVFKPQGTQMGTLIYDLPEAGGPYTLQVPDYQPVKINIDAR
ncbi:MAG: hypothetical protein SVR94_17045 [Pseudomonadota bacterium]|nr:hypothetical protein [Pseudomonadota bacterium]